MSSEIYNIYYYNTTKVLCDVYRYNIYMKERVHYCKIDTGYKLHIVLDNTFKY